MRDVAVGKTAADINTSRRGRAIVKGGYGTARRTLGLLGGILSFAVSEGIIPFSPSRGVKRSADSRRVVRLSRSQYRVLGNALREAEHSGENRTAILAIRLLALTGCRRGEIERLQWAEIDLEAVASAYPTLRREKASVLSARLLGSSCGKLLHVQSVSMSCQADQRMNTSKASRRLGSGL